MRRTLIAAVLALGLTLGPLSSRAADVPQLGVDATADQITNALTPKPGAAAPSGLQMRGLNPSTSRPAQAAAPAPAVGLDIRFKVNSAELSEQSRETVARLAAAINAPQLAQYRFKVEGHTDSSGRPERNLTLSRQRAETVRSRLISAYGVSPARLDAVGLGSRQPLDAGDPANPANRRVQVVNIGP
jgi:OmpA-OmpF porin, OOP family